MNCEKLNFPIQSSLKMCKFEKQFKTLFMDLVGNKFYQNLGKLFFAVAACDNVVRDEEFASLKKTVTNHWMEIDDTEDEFGNDAVYQIEIVFDFLHASAFEDHANDFVDDFELLQLVYANTNTRAIVNFNKFFMFSNKFN